ncbi:MULTISPECIES: hypothetical protein [Mesonia]|uniref:Uncharacterized protein n=1 Tax=Mesonia oceanica TaxID=2687242 RepID=A0AC61YCD1_9FLAO|nr:MULTISPECIES: hypothetical protein [Mesonia]MAN27813.1 hypothetical protein [Mesonia sp.]MAQ40993.1 hypothetical protein [Mesonia sp.]VVV01085.1 hypothetical protein FVB9532_02364 [Mesonia oceanica]|tara:strand:- start:84831 stop:85157 length:327 start_codon:yes stop_codon:yes gene_type:complete
MSNSELQVSKKLVCGMVIFGILFTVVGTFFKIMHFPLNGELLTFGIFISGVSWVIIMADMLQQELINKGFWILSMFILPWLIPLLYLYRRNKLIQFNASAFLKEDHQA